MEILQLLICLICSIGWMWSMNYWILVTDLWNVIWIYNVVFLVSNEIMLNELILFLTKRYSLLCIFGCLGYGDLLDNPNSRYASTKFEFDRKSWEVRSLATLTFVKWKPNSSLTKSKERICPWASLVLLGRFNYNFILVLNSLDDTFSCWASLLDVVTYMSFGIWMIFEKLLHLEWLWIYGFKELRIWGMSR